MCWEGYSDYEMTWEPPKHLPPDIVRYFHITHSLSIYEYRHMFFSREFMNPQFETSGVLSAIGRLRHEMEHSLRSLSTAKFSLYFPHDVYNFLFVARGEKAERKGWTAFITPSIFPRGGIRSLLRKERVSRLPTRFS